MFSVWLFSLIHVMHWKERFGEIKNVFWQRIIAKPAPSPYKGLSLWAFGQFLA
jgi:hypothetical protein